MLCAVMPLAADADRFSALVGLKAPHAAILAFTGAVACRYFVVCAQNDACGMRGVSMPAATGFAGKSRGERFGGEGSHTWLILRIRRTIFVLPGRVGV